MVEGRRAWKGRGEARCGREAGGGGEGRGEFGVEGCEGWGCKREEEGCVGACFP